MHRGSLDVSDTLFALSSGSLPCAVALVRLSGSRAFDIARQLFSVRPGESLPRERGLHFGALRDERGERLDTILLLTFVGPHSFTGEDVIEFQVHGSVAIVERLTAALGALGARAASKGEFSYRAFLNGKMSESDLEALGDVFLAKDGADLDRIYRRKDGSVTREVEGLRQNLIGVQAVLDTAIDFSDEYSSVVAKAKAPLDAVIQGCSELIHRYSVFRQGGQVGRIVLAGRPNAGKSSLFNSLLCRYRAIVHPEAGTTRDVIEEDIEVSGRRWKLVDTAGVRDAERGAEREGIAMGEEFLASSAFWILVVDGTSELTPAEEGLLSRYGSIPHLIVWNKSDLSEFCPRSGSIAVSAQSGSGIGQLWKSLESGLSEIGGIESNALPSAVQTARLTEVHERLLRLRESLNRNFAPEALAEENRRVLSSLSEVVGVVDTEMVLDRVFGEFCIGK